MYKGTRGIAAAILVSVMILVFLPRAMAEDGTKIADAEKDRDNTWLSVGGLFDPDIPPDKDAPWSGSYVYFGDL